MNQIVRRWRRHVERVSQLPKAPDTVTIDNQKLKFKEPKMAKEVRLPKRHFDSVVRMIKRSSMDRAMMLRTATYNTLKRLGVRRNRSKAVLGVPDGSDQVDTGSIVAWLNKVKPSNADAIQQVVAIDATVVQRTRGR